MWPNYKFHVPENKRYRYICHTDAKNEADDQFTIAHVMMTDKLDVKAVIAGHFNACFGRYPDGTTATESYKEIEKVFDLMHIQGACPVLMGSEYPLKDEKTPQESEGARFIVEEAMKDDDRPLFIGMQGAITDLASAILMEPAICSRMTAIWIGGGDYPDGGNEFNLFQDVAAANVVFASDMPVWQVTKTAYKQFTISLAELQARVMPHGKIGQYLFDQMVELNDKLAPMGRDWPHGETWSLGDEGVVAVLLEELEQDSIYTLQKAPRVNPDLSYSEGTNGKMVRVYHKMNARLDLEDLYAKLAINFPTQES